MKNEEEINYDTIYHSKFDGDYKIIKEIERDKFNHRQVIIKWINTGNEQPIEYQKAKKQIARDIKKREIDYNKIYQSNNFGPFKILRKLDEKLKSNHVLVEILFIETGTIKKIRLADALVGNIRDEYRKTIHGVACKGNASSYHPAYNMWLSMINRCYNPNDQRYNIYGALGITVCSKWLCFEYFLEDLPLIDGYELWLNNRGKYQLDKDYKQMNLPKNKRVYSLETCCFLSNSENSRLASYEHINKNYIGVGKVGERYRATILLYGEYTNLGIYDTPELAAAAYNNAIDCFYPDSTIKNNVQYINPSDLIKLSSSNNVICRVVKK